jgi:hypothetical protein
MRGETGRFKRLSARLSRAMPKQRLARAIARARNAALAEPLARAIARTRNALLAGPIARAVASSRLARVAGDRLDRPHVVGLLVGGGAAVALGLLSSLAEPADQSRAAGGRRTPVVRATPLATSPTRFQVALQDVRSRRPSRGGREYYRKTTTRHVPAATEVGYLPLYRKAGRTFGVSWRLIASIHRQETAFSTVAGTYHGLNAFGCCAGPMQFNVRNGPPTTWALYRRSFRLAKRPHRYPHRSRAHPSVYDDYDAIMAAAALLRDSGATDLLDGGAWSAAYAYYGHDRFGVEYADQVVARAQGWERDGFCVNCPEDEALVAVLDELYGVDARRQLRAEELRRKHHRHKRRHDASKHTRQADDRSDTPPEPLDLPRPGREPVATPATPAPAATTTTPPPPPTTTTTPAAPAQPATKPCTPVTRLLGCRP